MLIIAHYLPSINSVVMIRTKLYHHRMFQTIKFKPEFQHQWHQFQDQIVHHQLYDYQLTPIIALATVNQYIDQYFPVDQFKTLNHFLKREFKKIEYQNPN